MLRRLFVSFAFAALTLSAGTIRAAPVTFYFGGTLSSVDSALTSVFSVGDSFFGSLTFESTTVDSDANSNVGSYGPAPAFTVNINGQTFSDSGGGGGEVTVVNDIHGGIPNFDGFYGSGCCVGLNGPTVGAFVPVLWDFIAEDWDATMYTSDVLPITPPPLSDLESAAINIRYNDGVAQPELWGDFNYLSLTPVPEPEIYAMIGVGLGLMGWVGRRRKQQGA